MTGNALVDRILMALNLLALFAALGIHFYAQNIFQKPLPDDQTEFGKLKKDAMEFRDITPIKLEKLVINLQSRTKRIRVLELESAVLTFKHEQKPKIESNKPILVDIIIQAVGEMSPSEINSVSGKILLESRIKSRFQQETKLNVIHKVFFSRFVVQ